MKYEIKLKPVTRPVDSIQLELSEDEFRLIHHALYQSDFLVLTTKAFGENYKQPSSTLINLWSDSCRIYNSLQRKHYE